MTPEELLLAIFGKQPDEVIIEENEECNPSS